MTKNLEQIPLFSLESVAIPGQLALDLDEPPRTRRATKRRAADSPAARTEQDDIPVPHIPVEAPRGSQTPCEANRPIFLGILDEPPELDASRQEQARYTAAMDVARGLCEKRCPRFQQCLQDATTGPEVSGFMAGTTLAERNRLRRALKVAPKSMDIAAYAGAPEQSRRVDVERAKRVLRRTPDLALAELADMLECSESSAKRWRRRILHSDWSAPARREPGPQEITAAYQRLRAADARQAG